MMKIDKILKAKIEKRIKRLLTTQELSAVFVISTMHKEELEESLEDEAEEFCRALQSIKD